LIMSWLIENFNLFDKSIAIIYRDKKYTYKELFLEILNIEATVLDKIESGEVVAILADYSFKSIALLLALYKNKNIIVPIASSVSKEIDEKIKESFCTKAIKLSDGFEVISYEVDSQHEMITSLQMSKRSGLILFSSGSTGKPKAMVHDFDNMVEHYKNKKHKSMNMLVFLMFDHIGGINTLLNIFAIGATMIIPQNRDAKEICRLIQEYKIRILPSSPTFLNLILMSKADEVYDLSSLRMITYGTEAMPESLLLRLKKRFPKAKLLQTFGTSETGIANTSSRSSDSTYIKIDDPHLKYKIVDNELWLKSDMQILGYLNSSMDSFEDGWFKSGDLVEEMEDGFIKIIGRNKEVINVGGEKVLPTEVESVILSMPEIKDVMVYGEKNAITGQSVVCEVVTDIDKKSIKKTIRAFCKDKIENYKIPTKVVVVDSTNFSDRFKKMRIH